jgi:hypothetical protein
MNWQDRPGQPVPHQLFTESYKKWREKHRAAGDLPPSPGAPLGVEEMDLAREMIQAVHPKADSRDDAVVRAFWNASKASGAARRIKEKWSDLQRFGDPAAARPRRDDGRLE